MATRGLILGAIISGRTSLLWPDGIHPQPCGAKVYAAMIKAAVAQAVRPALSAAG